MNIYYLAPPKTKVSRFMDNPYGKSITIPVDGNEWYAARAKAFAHAMEYGEKSVLICAGHAVPTQVQRDPSKKGMNGIGVRTASPHTDHALLLYCIRLLKEYTGQVNVPPLQALPQLHRGWTERVPTPPMVSAYSLSAIQAVEHRDSSLGYNLVRNGFQVLTLGDFGYVLNGGTPLDEYGSTSKWMSAYERFQHEFF